MTLERFRELCLKQPGATEQIQWGADAVFKVGGKMFAVACTDMSEPHAKACSFKCDDETFAELCERDGVVPAPYLARAKWVAMDHWRALPDREVADLVARAYRIVRGGLTKKAQAALDTAPPPRAVKARASTAKGRR
jgi:predicted DNA-binding protein (MmcQ/YjbR family)